MNAMNASAAAFLQYEEIIAEAEAGTFGAYSTYASTTLVAYACLTTFGQEVTYIWDAPRRPAAILYFIIRYASLLSEAVFTGLNEGPTCNALLGFGDWLQIFTIAGGYILQIIRTRAIYQKSNWLTALLGLAALPAIIFRAWLISIASCDNPDPSVTLSLLDLVAELLFESIILLVTVWRTYYLVKQQRVLGVQKGSLIEAIMANGILYYCTIVPFDIIGLALIGLNSFESTVLLQFIAELNIPLRSIVLSQFIVDLRMRSEGGGSSTSTSGSGVSTGYSSAPSTSYPSSKYPAVTLPSSYYGGANYPSITSPSTTYQSSNYTSAFKAMRRSIDEDFGEQPYPTLSSSVKI